MFAQLFRLLSFYSLVKPMKGSNITGGEMLTTLLNLEDLKKVSMAERRKELDKRLDDIIEAGKIQNTILSNGGKIYSEGHLHAASLPRT